MDRRDFIKNTAVTTGGLAMAPNLLGKDLKNKNSGQKDRPNILLIMTDQQTASAMSCTGNPDLKTPAMDFLSRHGVRFEQAYCPQPLCGPCRSSMLTGKMPHQVKATVNLPEKHGYWSQDTRIMGKIFKEAGYDTGYVGKWHLPVPVEEKDFHGFDYITNTKRRDWQDASIPADCNDFLNRKREKPFFLVSSFINPHDICEWARRYDLRMEPIGQPPEPEQCPVLPDNHEIPQGEPNIIREQQSRHWNTYPTREWNDGQWRQYRWAYNRLVEHVDRYVGYVIDGLRKSGELENTVILFVSDHGDGYGHHKWNQKQVLYNEVSNVPFMVSWYKKYKPGIDKTNLVNTGLDLIPTMCDYAGISKPAGFDGLGLRQVVEGDKPSNGRDYVVLETEFAQGEKSYDIRGRAVIGEGWKYIVYDKGQKREQLFHLDSDPGEMKDLLNDPASKKVLKRMRKELENWCGHTNDSFIKSIPS